MVKIYPNWEHSKQSQFEINMERFNALPVGWVESFVPELEKALRSTLGEYIDDWFVVQAKEKHGVLRIYWTWNDRSYSNKEVKELDRICEKLNKIINKYEQISLSTCAKCGKEATYFSDNWALPFCEECK